METGSTGERSEGGQSDERNKAAARRRVRNLTRRGRPLTRRELRAEQEIVGLEKSFGSVDQSLCFRIDRPLACVSIGLQCGS
jgi:hypothetical protein